jgi:hypothetical protein
MTPGPVGYDFDDLGDPENSRVYMDRLISRLLLKHALSGQTSSVQSCSKKCLSSVPVGR